MTMRVASVISAGSPMAFAAAGSRTAQIARAMTPPARSIAGRDLGWLAMTSSTLATEEPLRLDQKHQSHNQIYPHGGQTCRERIGLRHRHEAVKNSRQETTQQCIRDPDDHRAKKRAAN